jgi:hypothetical protein
MIVTAIDVENAENLNVDVYVANVINQRQSANVVV